MKSRQKPPRAGVTAQQPKRSTVVVASKGALMQTVYQTLQAPAVRIALANYIEGKGLTGDWILEFPSPRLVPIDTPSPNGDSA